LQQGCCGSAAANGQGKGRECVETALAKKECGQEKCSGERFAEWARHGIKFLIEIRKSAFIKPW
jgi:hypothetical protein